MLAEEIQSKAMPFAYKTFRIYALTVHLYYLYYIYIVFILYYNIIEYRAKFILFQLLRDTPEIMIKVLCILQVLL